jgi:CheY-like chemotaxis protein
MMPTAIAQPSRFLRDRAATIIRCVRVMVVDGNAEVRRMMHRVVGDLAQIVDECVTPEEAIAAYDACRPDVLIIDLGDAPRDGVWATRAITRAHPDAVVVVVSQFPDAAFLAAARQAGARATVRKENLLDIRQYLPPDAQLSRLGPDETISGPASGRKEK